MDEVELRREAYGSALCVNRGFQVLLVLEGEAEFQWRAVPCGPAGARALCPHGVASYQCTAEGTCRLLECGLPAREAAANRGGAPAGAPPLCFAHFPQENRPFFS
ncbi:MAG: hypothetical protein ACLRIS_03130 [Flavonifractor plautii]